MKERIGKTENKKMENRMIESKKVMLAAGAAAVFLSMNVSAADKNIKSGYLNIEPFPFEAIEEESSPEYEIQTLTGETENYGPVMETECALETETEAETETETETKTEAETGTEAEIQAETEPADSELPSELYGLKNLNELWELHGIQPVFPYGTLDYATLQKEKRFPLLKRILENRIETYDGVWSVYVKNLNTGESFVIHDQPMKSASVMKLFILGTVYKAFDAGELEQTEEIMALVRDMITVSDNQASNQLLYRLGDSSYEKGIQKVDAFIREYGFSDDTREYNGFNDASVIFDSEHFNQVTARDCGKLLEDIYRRTWVNRAESNEIEQMLLNQHTRYKIPAGLPEGVLCGNKTGEMDTTENDAAIIYSENCDYILVVLSSDWNDKNTAISRIADLSRLVYDFLN